MAPLAQDADFHSPAIRLVKSPKSNTHGSFLGVRTAVASRLIPKGHCVNRSSVNSRTRCPCRNTNPHWRQPRIGRCPPPLRSRGHLLFDSLAEVSRRPDELGQLARVFQRMAQEVAAREQQFKHQIQTLRVEIDEAKKSRE